MYTRRIPIVMPTSRHLLATALLVTMAACGGDERDRASTLDPTAAGPGRLGAGLVFTADEGSNSVSRVDLQSGQVTRLALSIEPHNVQVSPDGEWLLAVGPPAGDGMPAEHGAEGGREHDETVAAPGRLVILATDSLGDQTAAEVLIGQHPAHVVVGPDNRLAYTTNSADNSVIVVDIARRQAVDTIPTWAFLHGLRLRPDGREIYVACVDDNSVSVIDTQAAREVTRIPVGRAPVQVGFTPDGRHAYVSLRDENGVAVIDAATRQRIATIPVGSSPIQLFATPDGRFVYVANQGTETTPDSTVSVIDTRRNAVVETLITGRGAHGVVVSDDGSRVFIANSFANTVSVIDVASQRVIGSVAVGEKPGGITYLAPD